MKSYSWPDPLPRPDYPLKTAPIPREIVHAVGAIVIAWTHCEDIHLEIIKSLTGFGLFGKNDYRIGSRIFDPMGNRQRNDLLSGLLDETSLAPGWKETIHAFRRQFDACLVNRNLVTHAIFLEEEAAALVVSRKSTPKIQDRYIPIEIAFWEDTIKEIQDLYHFGQAICDGAFSNAPQPLPVISRDPRNLMTLLPPHIAQKHPPQS